MLRSPRREVVQRRRVGRLAKANSASRVPSAHAEIRRPSTVTAGCDPRQRWRKRALATGGRGEGTGAGDGHRSGAGRCRLWEVARAGVEVSKAGRQVDLLRAVCVGGLSDRVSKTRERTTDVWPYSTRRRTGPSCVAGDTLTFGLCYCWRSDDAVILTAEDTIYILLGSWA